MLLGEVFLICANLYYYLSKSSRSGQVCGARPVPGRSSFESPGTAGLSQINVGSLNCCAPGRRALRFGCGCAALGDSRTNP